MPSRRRRPAAAAAALLAATTLAGAGCAQAPEGGHGQAPLLQAQALPLAQRAGDPGAARLIPASTARGGAAGAIAPLQALPGGRWTWLPGEYGAGDRVALQASSIVRVGPGRVVRFWTLTNLREPRPGPTRGTQVASLRTDLSVNCAERTTLTNGVYLYAQPAGQGDLVAATRGPEAGWVLIAPGSLGEDLYRQVCLGRAPAVTARRPEPPAPAPVAPPGVPGPEPAPPRFLVEPVPDAAPLAEE